jgi:hypothetical protein
LDLVTGKLDDMIRRSERRPCTCERSEEEPLGHLVIDHDEARSDEAVESSVPADAYNVIPSLLCPLPSLLTNFLVGYRSRMGESSQRSRVSGDWRFDWE